MVLHRLGEGNYTDFDLFDSSHWVISVDIGLLWCLSG